jgi:hypothetical protein
MRQVVACEYCGSLNVDRVKCENCGAVLPFDIKPAPPKVASATPDTPDVFIVYPPEGKRLAEMGRRPPLLARLGCGLLSWGIVLLALVSGTVIGVAGFSIYDDYLALQERGIVREGRVLDKRISTSDDSDTYYLRYGYPYQGQAYEHEQIVSEGLYNSYRVGATIPVRLDPQNPGLSRIDGTQNYDDAIFAWWCGTLVSVGVPLLFFASAQAARRRRRLARNYQVVMGKVFKVQGAIDEEDKVYKITLTYRFISPQSGKVCQKTLRDIARSDLDPDRLPTVGTPVKVAYLDDKTFEVL